jgi:hypothetical protein
LPFEIEKDEGMRSILLGVASSPVIEDGDDPVGHGEGHDHAWFFDSPCVNVKYFVRALAIDGWAKEDPREHAGCMVFVIMGSS